MVGKAIKDYAQEKGMAIKNGVAFGVYRDFMMSMQEGSGWKSVSFAVRFDDENVKEILEGYFNQKEIRRDYRINKTTLSPNAVVIEFLDNPGTMKKIVAEMKKFSRDASLEKSVSDFYSSLADRILLMMNRQPDCDYISFEGP